MYELNGMGVGRTMDGYDTKIACLLRVEDTSE